MDTIKIGIFIVAMLVFGALTPMASAATEAEIQQAIDDGIVWLAAQQNPDGSWGTSYQVGHTGFAVIKLCSHDPVTYSDNISGGLDYLFANAYVVNISIQPAGDPDTNGNGTGVVFYVETLGDKSYETGIAMMALACGCASPDAVVDVPGSAVDGWTYEQVLQDAVDYLAFGQNDENWERGGWGYNANDVNWSDNSITGYAALALGYAETSECEITVPGFVYDELDIWIDYIQNDPGAADDGGEVDPDGGSGYNSSDYWVNIYKTGNLLFEMALVGDAETTGRVQDAIDYIVRHWNDSIDPGWNGTTADYHAMYTTMKGLEVFGIDTIDGIDWFEEFSDVIVAQQNANGSWSGTSSDGGNQILGTEWALLTLQKEVPEIRQTPPEAAPAPTLTPIGLIALAGLLSVIAAIIIRIKKRR